MCTILLSRKFPPARIDYEDTSFTLVIRPFTVTDAPAVHDAIQSSLDDLKRFISWAHETSSVPVQEERLLRFHADYLLGNRASLGVFDGTGRLLMCAGWSPSVSYNRNALTMGYWADSRYTGKGLATLTVKILASVVFECMECDRLEIFCHEANTASRRVAEKCGFALEARLRDYNHVPSAKLVSGGYTQCRSALQFVLFPTDARAMPWYDDILRNTIVSSLRGETIKLQEFVSSQVAEDTQWIHIPKSALHRTIQDQQKQVQQQQQRIEAVNTRSARWNTDNIDCKQQ